MNGFLFATILLFFSIFITLLIKFIFWTISVHLKNQMLEQAFSQSTLNWIYDSYHTQTSFQWVRQKLSFLIRISIGSLRSIIFVLNKKIILILLLFKLLRKNKQWKIHLENF